MPPPTASLNPKAPHPKTGGNDRAEDHVGGKPDQKKYNDEQDAITKEIAQVKTKLDAVRSRIDLSRAPKSDDRRSQLKSEMDGLRGEQGKFKDERNKLFAEMRKLQDNLNKKIKDVNAQRQKTGFKNASEVGQRIKQLESQVESGSMKLVDEKRALQEISQLRRAQKTMENSASSDEAIAADKARIDELKKKLDDPEAKKVSDRFDELKKEMDALRAEGDKAYQERNKLFDERRALEKQMDELYGKKRAGAQAYNEAKDAYYAKVQAIRQARQDKFKAEKAKEDAARRDEEITQMREDAKVPAYTSEIEDCKLLINYLTGKSEDTQTAAEKKAADIAGVKALEVRKVESDFAGMRLKKKDEELEGFFGGSGKGKKKGRKGGNAGGSAASANGSGAATPTTPSNDAVNLPLGMLSALLAFGIQPPSGRDDVARTVSDLETKMAWFEANSAAQTQKEIERVEKLVAKLQKKSADAAPDADKDADKDAAPAIPAAAADDDENKDAPAPEAATEA